jgi:hypothetical protein
MFRLRVGRDSAPGNEPETVTAAARRGRKQTRTRAAHWQCGSRRRGGRRPAAGAWGSPWHGHCGTLPRRP